MNISYYITIVTSYNYKLNVSYDSGEVVGLIGLKRIDDSEIKLNSYHAKRFTYRFGILKATTKFHHTDDFNFTSRSFYVDRNIIGAEEGTLGRALFFPLSISHCFINSIVVQSFRVL
jgi:hypothetical protein